MGVCQFVLVISLTLFVVSKTTGEPLPGLTSLFSILGGSAPTAPNTAAVPVQAPTAVKAQAVPPPPPSAVNTAAVQTQAVPPLTSVSNTGVNAAAAEPAPVIKSNTANDFFVDEDDVDEDGEEGND